VGQELRRELQGVVRDYRGELARSLVEVKEVAMKAREVVREASSGGWVAPVAMVLVAIGIALPTFATGGLAAVGPYLVVLGVGVFLGWWVRG